MGYFLVATEKIQYNPSCFKFDIEGEKMEIMIYPGYIGSIRHAAKQIFPKLIKDDSVNW